MATYTSWVPVNMPASLKDTPVGTPSIRTLSDCSTPSPSSAATNQEPKRAKLPCSDLPLTHQPVKSVESAPVSTSTLQYIIEAMQYQLKIAEHVSVSVTAMANSVPTIISESLNDRINTIEAENKRLSGQVIQLTEKVNALEMNNLKLNRNLMLLNKTVDGPVCVLLGFLNNPTNQLTILG